MTVNCKRIAVYQQTWVGIFLWNSGFNDVNVRIPKNVIVRSYLATSRGFAQDLDPVVISFTTNPKSSRLLHAVTYSLHYSLMRVGY